MFLLDTHLLIALACHAGAHDWGSDHRPSRLVTLVG